MVSRFSARAASSRRCRGVWGRTTPWRRIASRSALSMPGLDLPRRGSGREQALEPGSPFHRGLGLRLAGLLFDLLVRLLRLGRLSRRLGPVHSHELLLPSPRRQALEVAANRIAHLVEMTLFAHAPVLPGSSADSC